MRIEFVTDTFPPDINGVAMTLGKLTKLLKEQGHKVHITHTGEAKNSGETSSWSFGFPGYKEVRLGYPVPFKFKKRWKKKRPDVVYIAAESLLGFSAMRAARKLNIPIVAGFHTNFQQYLKKYFISSIERPTMGYLKKFHKACDCTMVPSQYMKQYLEKKGFKNVKIMGRGIDTDFFNPNKRSEKLRESWGASAEDCVITIVGRLAVEKNLNYALNTVKYLKKQLKGAVNLKTVILGDGPLKQRLQKDYPTEQFHYAGMQSGEALATHYASADVMFFASETETFGNVTLEALASGLTVACYDYAAAADHIQDGVNGFKAPLSNEIALKEALLKAIQNRDNTTIKAAATLTTEGISWKGIAEQFSDNLAEIVQSKPITERRVNYNKPLKVRSLFLSNIHLGNQSCRATEVLRVLKYVHCKKLYLNGDIIEGNALKRKSEWPKSHNKVIRAILKKANNKKSEVIYTRGNHDDFLSPFLPSEIGGLKIVQQHVHHTQSGDEYLVLHGDGFDSASTNHRWFTQLGLTKYDFLLKVNRVHNKYRRWRGKDSYSVNKRIKTKARSAENFLPAYEQQIKELAQKGKYNGIICGHLHQPENKMLQNIHYLNSGDWRVQMNCLVEHLNGEFEILSYEKILEKLENS